MKGLANFPKYESYRDSGFEWLDSIPSDWELIKMKFLYKDSSIKNRALETLLSVTQSNGVIPRDSVENRMVMPSGNLESFKYIEQGDFAISLRSFEGGLEYCHHSGIISPAYTVLKQIREDLLASYYKYLFKSFSFISEMQTSIVGIREGKNISYDELRYSYLPIPLPTEQKRIAQFLDQKTAQIDGAIAIKEQQIKLLQERKQIIIQKAVTQGLDPNAPMKDSGVEWIGQIPEHWEVKPLKYLLKLKNTRLIADNSSLEYIGMECINSFDGKRNEVKSEAEGLSTLFQAGDILFGKLRPYLAKVYLTELKGLCSTEFLVYRVKKGNNVFFSKLLLSNSFIRAVDSSTYGSKMPRASSTYIGNLKIVNPPIEEQTQIASFIEEQNEIFDRSLMLMRAQIETFKEYKTILITSAVTGKIKVTPDMVEQ